MDSLYSYNERIQWCLDNDERCKTISENAIKFVKEKLNWDYVIQYNVNQINKGLMK
jgi:hypothetical protein